MFGLGVDSVVQLTVVTATGSIVNASAQEHADLFFALRGGGGGNWGVIVEGVIRLHRVPSVAGAPAPGMLPWYNITWAPPQGSGPGSAGTVLRAALSNWLNFTRVVTDADFRFAFDVYQLLKVRRFQCKCAVTIPAACPANICRETKTAHQEATSKCLAFGRAMSHRFTVRRRFGSLKSPSQLRLTCTGLVRLVSRHLITKPKPHDACILSGSLTAVRHRASLGRSQQP